VEEGRLWELGPYGLDWLGPDRRGLCVAVLGRGVCVAVLGWGVWAVSVSVWSVCAVWLCGLCRCAAMAAVTVGQLTQWPYVAGVCGPIRGAQTAENPRAVGCWGWT